VHTLNVSKQAIQSRKYLKHHGKSPTNPAGSSNCSLRTLC